MRGSGGPWSCSRITSIAEVDRRRVAHLRPEDEESSDQSSDENDGSSSSARERGEVKERRKPDRRWQSREIGGGLPQTRSAARAGRFGNSGASVDRRRSGSGKSSSLTRGRRKRSWFLGGVRIYDPCARGARQGASEVVRLPCAWPKTPGQGGAAERRRPAPSLTPPEERGSVRESAEAGGAPSSARPAGVGSSKGGPTPHGRTRPRSGKHHAVSAARFDVKRARKSSDPRVLVS